MKFNFYFSGSQIRLPWWHCKIVPEINPEPENRSGWFDRKREAWPTGPTSETESEYSGIEVGGRRIFGQTNQMSLKLTDDMSFKRQMIKTSLKRQIVKSSLKRQIIVTSLKQRTDETSRTDCRRSMCRSEAAELGHRFRKSLQLRSNRPGKHFIEPNVAFVSTASYQSSRKTILWTNCRICIYSF